MKLKSLIMFSAAALAFAACNNDNDVIGDEGVGVEGLATISVKISEPTLSRAISASNYTNTTAVTLNSIKLVLTAQTGSDSQEFLLSDYNNNRDTLLAKVEAYQFVGVRNPSKMEVYINTDKSSGWTQEDIIDAGLAEPLYASSSDFKNQGDIDGDGIEEYEVALAPEHTIARLEFGGIKHVESTDSTACMFATITIDGVVLDTVPNIAQVEGWDAEYMMAAPIGEDFELYDGSQPVWPANNQCFAYNILPVSGSLPILKVCFSNITIDKSVSDYSGIVWGNSEGNGYATVAYYLLDDASSAYAEAFEVDADGHINKFPAGYIYQVKSLEIPDEAIGTTWDGGKDIHVYAVVTVKDWTLVSGTVEWN